MKNIFLIIIVTFAFLISSCDENSSGYIPPMPQDISLFPNPVKLGEELTINFTWEYWYGIEKYYNLSAGEDGLLVYSNTAGVIESRDELWRDNDWNEGVICVFGRLKPSGYNDDWEIFTEIHRYTEFDINADGNCTIQFVVPNDAVSSNIILFPTNSTFSRQSLDKLIVQDSEGNPVEPAE